MYYIVNHTEHIIAADKSFLNLFSIENIDELYTKIALGDIQFTTSDGTIIITTKNGIRSYQTQNHMLSGMLGNITLVQVHPSEEESISVIDDEEPFDLLSNVEKAEIEESIEETIEERKVNTSPIVIDIESISQEIGISTNDYKNFLNEYIDTALDLEEDLRNTEEEKYYHAISTLSHLSNILHLPIITNIIEQLEDSQLDDRDPLIKSLYATITRLTTTETNISEEEIKFQIKNTATPVEKDITTESFGTINLDDVQPLYLDFEIETSANDLSLPVELIQEFVHDFIEQTHIETEKMLEAYEKGDLNTIQNISHLLKRAASNLRINALSDTLYKIQFCEDSSNLENLIKEYWGIFLSFENQINIKSKMKRD